MSQQDISYWDRVLERPQQLDEEQPLTRVTEALDSLFLKRSSERSEWELRRWPEGAEL
jgi:hypothetical protein